MNLQESLSNLISFSGFAARNVTAMTFRTFPSNKAVNKSQALLS